MCDTVCIHVCACACVCGTYNRVYLPSKYSYGLLQQMYAVHVHITILELIDG